MKVWCLVDLSEAPASRWAKDIYAPLQANEPLGTPSPRDDEGATVTLRAIDTHPSMLDG